MIFTPPSTSRSQTVRLVVYRYRLASLFFGRNLFCFFLFCFYSSSIICMYTPRTVSSVRWTGSRWTHPTETYRFISDRRTPLESICVRQSFYPACVRCVVHVFSSSTQAARVDTPDRYTADQTNNPNLFYAQSGQRTNSTANR